MTKAPSRRLRVGKPRSFWLGIAVLSGFGLADALPLSAVNAATATTFAVTLRPVRTADTTAPGQRALGTTTVRLPIFPGAAPAGTGPEISVDTAGSPYLRAGSARFVVRSTLAKVRAWYAVQMPSHGFIGASAAGVGANRPESLYTSKRNPGLTVELEFSQLPVHAQRIAIGYWVTDTTQAPRPATTYIPSDVQTALVRYQPVSLQAPLQWTTTTLHKGSALAALVRILNALPVDTRSNVSSESSLYGGASLRLLTTGGRAIMVTVDFQRNQVRVDQGPALFDLQNQVWTTLSADLGYQPYPTR